MRVERGSRGGGRGCQRGGGVVGSGGRDGGSVGMTLGGGEGDNGDREGW